VYVFLGTVFCCFFSAC